MAFLAAPLALPLIGSTTVGSVIGTVFSGLSMIGDFISSNNMAKAQAQQGAYENKVAQQNAIQAEAVSQREAINRINEGKLLASSATAKAAASGGGSDPTIVNLVGDIKTQAQKNSLMELYSGKSQGDAYRQQGALSLYQGKLDSAATKSQARSNLFGGLTSLAMKYGGGGPSAKTGYQYIPGSGDKYLDYATGTVKGGNINWYK